MMLATVSHDSVTSVLVLLIMDGPCNCSLSTTLYLLLSVSVSLDFSRLIRKLSVVEAKLVGEDNMGSI